MPPIDVIEEDRLPHYWGDVARQLSVGGAALMLVGAPWYANALTQQFPLIIIGAILAVGFAALVNPLKRSVSVFDAIISGIIAVSYAPWAFFAYDAGEYLSFVLRMAVAIIFLFAFYFNTKTVRAMILHQVAKPGDILERERNAAAQSHIRTDGTEAMFTQDDTDSSV